MENKISPFLSLKITHYRNYLLGGFVSDMGSQMQIVAVSWQVYAITHNPASLGIIGLSNFIPILLFSLIGGLMADRMDRKKLMVLSQLAMAVGAMMLFLLTYLKLINPWMIYLILVFYSTASSFSLPTRQAVVPNLVPKKYFMNAVSLMSLQFQLATMIGPAIAGFMIAGWGVGSIYLFNSLSFLVFIFAVTTIKKPLNVATKEVEFSLSSIKEGIGFVIKTPILYSTMILDFLATFFGTATILMPVFATDILHVGARGLGALYAAPAIGGVAAGFLVAAVHHKLEHQGKIIIGSIILYGISTIAFGLSKFLPLSLIFLVLSGFGDMVATIIRNTIRHLITPDHLRGRMSSVMRIFFQGGPQLGDVEAGFLAKAVGAPVSVVVGGVGVILITSILAWKNDSLRKYQGKELIV